MIILGIDPGSIRTGWGVVRREGPKFHYVAAGTIEAGKDVELPQRLQAIYEALQAIVAEHAPTAIAVEDIFYARFAGAALKLGHARGIALLVGAQAGVPIAAYPPALVKRSIAGRGQADKTQVARVVGAILGLRELPEIDATDALAIAITHAQAARVQGVAQVTIHPRAVRMRKRA
jgi:crossover junction endodeoxyribonuclease RuvC